MDLSNKGEVWEFEVDAVAKKEAAKKSKTKSNDTKSKGEIHMQHPRTKSTRKTHTRILARF